MFDKEENQIDGKTDETNDELDSANMEKLDSHNTEISELKERLEKQKQNTNDYIEKWKRALADYENLNKRSSLDINNKVTNEINKIMLNFLTVYEDLIRASRTLADSQKNVEGLDIIIKNMASIFEEHNIKPIDTIGKMFDPNLHEAVSIVEDENFEDGMIKEEVGKGYISGNVVIKPSKVIVSKLPNTNE